MIKDKYELASKPERDRILGTSFIPSYGKFPVHNVKFNKLVQYLEKLNNDLQIPNPSEYQKAIQDTIKMKLNLSRLKILNDYALKEKEAGFGSDLLTSLSFRNWCGLGSMVYDNIKNDLDDPNRMFQIDRICRDHDIRYTKAKTQEEMNEADNIMMKEIFLEYVVNINKNFLTGDYKNDFTTWASSFKTVTNYILSLIETGYVGYVLKNTGETAYKILRAPYDYITTAYPLPELTDYLVPAGTFTQAQQPSRAEQIRNAIRLNERYRNMIGGQRAKNILKGIKSNALSLGITFVATNIVKDRLLALGSLVLIGLKKGVETLTGYQFADLTKHDVTDEDLENMIKVFETLQNQYLKESNLKPIKIGDEWLNVAIEIPPIQTINDDIKIIVEQNKTYNELNKTMVEAMPEPVLEPTIEPTKEPTPEPIQIYDNDEPLTEEELKRYNRYQKSYLNMVKLFSEINVVEEEEDTFERPYPDLPSTEMITGNKKRPIVPNIEKDIKDAKPSSLINTIDVQDEPIEQNKDIGQDLKPDEIKNKTEL
jgi:hypothetical protein